MIANDASTGKLLWMRKVGTHNGHDADGILTIDGQNYKKMAAEPKKVLPGALGGVETPYASDGSTVYAAVNNTAWINKNQATGTLENPLKSGGQMYAINQNTGTVKWVHTFPHSPYGAATVTNNLVFTTTFDGTVWALNKATGAVVWHKQLPAGTNAPLAISGDAVILGAGYPEGKGQVAQFIEFKLGGTGAYLTSSSGGGKGGTVKG
jgi:alcohol dehydrogenase (cytochrome c)